MNPEASLDQEKRKNIALIEKERTEKKSDLTTRYELQQANLENSAAQRVNQISGAIEAQQQQQSAIESALSQMPEGHPERKKAQATLKRVKEQIAELEHQLQRFRYDVEKQEKVLKFSVREHLKILLRNIAEKFHFEELKYREKKARLFQQLAGMKLAAGTNTGSSVMGNRMLESRNKEAKQGAG